MADKQRALSILLLCLTACSSVLSDDQPPYYYEYIATMQRAIDATIEAGVTPDDVDRTDNGARVSFECDELPASVVAKRAENVHELKPSDVQVIAALGDSLTAAMGAQSTSIFNMLTEYRGVSWSIGGDINAQSVFTLANFIERYNPNVRGYSTGKGTSNTNLNVAVSGAKALNMPSQAEELVRKIKNDQDIDINEDWKLVTLFIGGNDLCAYCQDNSRYSPEEYANHVVNTLDILKAELPRTFVSVVHTLDVTVVGELGGLFCGIVHSIACPCSTDKGATKEAAVIYRNEMEERIYSRYYDTDDFAVVIQPFTAGIEDVPRDDRDRPDKSFFSPDCFHFSQKAHKDAALSLWNNMLEPVGEKELGWEHNPNPKCPTEEFPYFFTNKNSQKSGSLGVAAAPPPPNTDNGSGGNLLAILLGSGVAAYVVTMTIIVVIVGSVWYRRRRHQHDLPTRVSCDTEKITLLKS